MGTSDDQQKCAGTSKRPSKLKKKRKPGAGNPLSLYPITSDANSINTGVTASYTPRENGPGNIQQRKREGTGRVKFAKIAIDDDAILDSGSDIEGTERGITNFDGKGVESFGTNIIRSPHDILQLFGMQKNLPSSRSAPDSHNRWQRHYDKFYYAALVDLHIQDQSHGNKQDRCVVEDESAVPVLKHDILGNFSLNISKLKSCLSFPQSKNIATYDADRRKQYIDEGNVCTSGFSLQIELLSFPTGCKMINHSPFKMNFPVPIEKTRGRLKVMSHHGATVREKFGINDEDENGNRKLYKLLKGEEREFVCIKWLPPPDGVDEENLIGVMRYKIRLEANYSKHSIGSVNDEEGCFGWISDRSRLREKPYWIVITI